MYLFDPRSRRLKVLAFCALAGFVLTTCPGVGWVPAALAAPRDDLKTAKDHFDFGEYGQALSILDPAIASGQLKGATLRDFLALRARCAVGMGQKARADDDFCRLHRMDPAWRPDAVNYTSDEIAAFEAAVAGCAAGAAATTTTSAAAAEEGGGSFITKPVVWLVAGVGIAAALLLGGGDEETPPDQPLGSYPPPPSK